MLSAQLLFKKLPKIKVLRKHKSFRYEKPRGSPLGLLLHLFNDPFESFWMFLREVRKYLAVKRDIFFLQSVNKSAVGKPFGSHRRIDDNLPLPTEICFSVVAVFKRILSGMENSFACLALLF